MTRKQLLLQILYFLDHPDEFFTADHNMKHEMRESILSIVEELPITNWTEATIHDTMRQFALDHGRNPTLHDMERRKKMPSHASIMLRFGMNMKEFLDTFYPPRSSSKSFPHHTKDELLEDFVSRYNELRPLSAREYNKNRRAGMPTWPTLAKLYGMHTWREFLKFAGLPVYSASERIPRHEKSQFTLETEGGVDAIDQKIERITQEIALLDAFCNDG